MAIESPGPLYSYDDYAAIGDDRRYQVVEGALVLSPSPSLRHQELLLRLAEALRGYVRDTHSGFVVIAPFDVVLRPERPAVVLQPDIVFISKARKHILTEAQVVGAPDLVIEVLSPSNARLDRGPKLDLYAAYGVPEVWFVPHDVDRIETLVLQSRGHYAKAVLHEPGDVLTSALLPGFALPITSIFEPPLA